MARVARLVERGIVDSRSGRRQAQPLQEAPVEPAPIVSPSTIPIPLVFRTVQPSDPGTSGSPARGLAALGSEDREGKGEGRAPEIQDGLSPLRPSNFTLISDLVQQS